ncbi:uncharacterized protein EV154DRAFT_435046, partial [Mucor mucedo]|uniref:uncharacterized protein n=1 Tax=Mucor mucedo TaxID=29922 RepID=UPI00221EC214
MLLVFLYLIFKCKMRMAAEHAACLIYGFEVSTENCTLAMKLLHDAGLEPVTIVNGDPTLAVAISTTKINMEPWRFNRLISLNTTPAKVSPSTDSRTTSSINDVSSIALSRSGVLDLCKQILTLNAIPYITESLFLGEEEVYNIIKAYFPEDDLKTTDLVEWIGKDGSWGPTKRQLRNFTWADITNVQQYRKNVRATASTICTIGYCRKSKTKE